MCDGVRLKTIFMYGSKVSLKNVCYSYFGLPLKDY